MATHERAGQPARTEDLVDVSHLVTAYFDLEPDPDDVSATSLAGEPITGKLTEAPGNAARIGGLKVTTESAWFAARPSGTEDVYKIYAESFRGPEHLARVQEEAREVVSTALR